MATAGMLAALAVGLLAAAVSGVPDAMKVARGLVPEEGAAAGGVGVAGGEGAGQQRKGARILAAETLAYHAPLPNYLDHIPCRQALATTCGRMMVTIRSQTQRPTPQSTRHATFSCRPCQCTVRCV
ncbi:unnamed protein product [Closterium sp. NIES-53]